MRPAIKKVGDSKAVRREKFVERLLHSASGVFDMFTVYVGDQLGFYEAMLGEDPVTSLELASRTQTHERYVREWLEQQTVAGILEVVDEKAPPDERRFYLPAGHDEVLADRESLDYLAPLAQLLAGAVRPLDDLLQVMKEGGGIPFEAYGRDLWEGQARMNRTMFLQQLGREWLPSISEAHQRLQQDPPARVADIGCGAGWSSIGLARCYDKISVDGLDLDRASIEQARRNARDAGVENRVKFHQRDAGDPELAGQYDLVTAFECIHDVSNPVAVLKAMRRLAKEGATVLVVDERVGEDFTAKGNDVEWMMYGWSVMHCLPVGMAEQPSAGTGTVMRLKTLRQYALEAGFNRVEVLPIDHYFFQFYQLS